MRTLTRIALPLVLLALLASACGAAGNPADAAEVNGEAIPLAAVEERFEAIVGHPDFADQFDADEQGILAMRVQSGLLTELIHAKLWEQGAAELGIEVTETDIEERREQLIADVGGAEEFDELVVQSGLTPELLSDELRFIVLREGVQAALLAENGVTDEDVEAFYAEMREERYERVEARHVLVETEVEAEDVLERIDGGEAFSDVAEDVSIDPGTAEQGGDLGEFTRGRMVPEFEDAAFDADVGDLVGPVETEFGFHVIEVLARADQELGEVAEEIRAELSGGAEGEAALAWFRDVVTDADVVVNPRFGRWSMQAAEILPPDVEADVEADAPEPEDPVIDDDR